MYGSCRNVTSYSVQLAQLSMELIVYRSNMDTTKKKKKKPAFNQNHFSSIALEDDNAFIACCSKAYCIPREYVYAVRERWCSWLD